MSDDGPSNERWERTWEIFHELLEQPAEVRATQLEQLCAGESALRAEVAALLAAHEEGLPVLDAPPPVSLDPGDIEETQVADRGVIGAGSVLAGRFEIVRLVGVGGMGEVYEALDRELGSRVAVKTLLPSLAADRMALARFRKEILLARRVTHRNACRIFDLFQHEDLIFLTMEFLQGETLAAKLRREGPMEIEETWEMLEQIAAGLDAAHAVGIVHRDLKPANVLLVEESGGLRVVITDFGLATSHGLSASERVDLTSTGEVLGTPAYMAPEQLEGGEPTPATDVYALGLLLFELVSGHRPFEGGTAFSVASRRLQESPPSPNEHRPDLDRRWERVILRCLERDPTRRFATPRDVVKALAERSPASTVETVRRSPRIWVLTAALVAALALVGLWATRGPDHTQVNETALSPGVATKAGDVGVLDTVLIADFENRSGNAELDGVLESALARELANSSHIAVATRSRVRDALKLMRLPEDATLDPETARQVAVRDGRIRVVVTGSLAGTGADTMLTADLIEPGDGSVLGSVSTPAGEDTTTLSAALAQLARDLRVTLGDNLDPEPADTDRQKVTTRSFRALRLYEEAEVLIARSGQDATSEELLRDAIREDPEFASAHLLLGYAVFNQTSDTDRAMPHFERAMELADGVPDRERYFIRATYFFFSGDRRRSEANYTALLRLHPDHYWGNNNMGVLVGPTEGIPFHVRKATYRPNDLDASWDAAHALAIVGNRPGEAQPYITRVVELAEIDIPRWQEYEVAWARLWTFHAYWLSGDLDAARSELDRWAAELDGMSGAELMWMRRVMVQCFRSLGLLAEARSLLPLPDYELKRRYFSGVDATLAGDADAAAELMGGNGWDERWWGDVVLEDPIRVASLVRAGRATEAAQVLRAFESHNRAPTPDMAESEDSLQLLLAAFVDLAGGDLSQAERSLDAVLDRDWEHYGATFFLALTTLADIHHRTDRSEEAIALLERAVGERSRSYPFGMELWMSAQIDLAQLHRATGNEATAEALEGELRALTSQADPDFWLLRRLTP